MRNLFGEKLPTTEWEILDGISQLSPVVLVAFSGGNDSRALAHVAKAWAELHGIDLRLAAIQTGLEMDGWRQSVEDYARWGGLPLEIYTGEGFAYYRQYVEEFGFPGNAKHSQIQNRLKGRAFRKMKKVHGNGLVILSGIRKAESERRARLVSPYSIRETIQFVNPLFNWSDAKLYDWIDEHGIPEAPGKQWDCKCGATARHADEEWAEIEQQAPVLCGKLKSLNNPMPWDWGRFNPAIHQRLLEISKGQRYFFDENADEYIQIDDDDDFSDDGSLESFPVCVNCWRDKAAQEERAMEDW